MKNVLVASVIAATMFTGQVLANGCVGSYVGPLVIDAERGHNGMVETTVQQNGQVAIVLTGSDRVIDYHLDSSSSNMRAEISQDGKSLIISLGSWTNSLVATVQTERGRLHMVNIFTDKTDGIPFGSKIIFEN
ncbi:hypothetical protein ACQKPX_21125 [Photobacterium sp. DNB23_23_1]|uniref:Uncharacterized protein n=1 Tax=Photobacterium pectinilyticum TaxID=2906793 RepID=A0ABT1MVX5_9GAMM|nr:hypothetical protein [Photobacterium sp. ZSDE20]MCQ1056640.1 hypothetical protein [Photobacterium sp. ZSDE20]MDD1820776.1 hypothetical protein [Photobacterium sp. ZSDE20]